MDRGQIIRLAGTWILVGLTILVVVADACLIGFFIYDHCSYHEYPFVGKIIWCVPADISGSPLVWCNGTVDGYAGQIKLLFNDITCSKIGDPCPVVKIGRLELARRWLPRPSSDCLGMDLAWVIMSLVLSAALTTAVWFIGLAVVRWVDPQGSFVVPKGRQPQKDNVEGDPVTKADFSVPPGNTSYFLASEEH